MASIAQPRMLIVDDDSDMGALVRDTAELAGFDAESVTSAHRFFESASAATPDVMVIDLVMPDVDGMEVLKELARRGCPSKVIFMSGFQSIYLNIAQSLADALGVETIGLIPKPASIDDLERQFRDARMAISPGIAGHG